MLHAGTRDADRIALLERILADRGGRHLAADDDERDGIHVGRGDAGHRIGDAGAGGHETHADIARGARIGVGGMNRGLFVAHEDVLDLVLLVQLVVDVEYRAAGIAPNELDFFVGQRAHEHGAADGFSFEGGSRIRRGEFRAGHIHSFTFRIFGKKLIGCSLPGLWLGFKRRVQLTGGLLGHASNETVHL